MCRRSPAGVAVISKRPRVTHSMNLAPPLRDHSAASTHIPKPRHERGPFQPSGACLGITCMCVIESCSVPEVNVDCARLRAGFDRCGKPASPKVQPRSDLGIECAALDPIGFAKTRSRCLPFRCSFDQSLKVICAHQSVSNMFAGARGSPTSPAGPASPPATPLRCASASAAAASSSLRARSRSSAGGFQPGPSSQYQKSAPFCGPSGSHGHLPAKKRVFLSHFISTNDHFTKTGSGQT